MEELKLILETIQGFSGMAKTVILLYFAKEYLMIFAVILGVFYFVYKGYTLLSDITFSNRIGTICGFDPPLIESEKKRIIEIVKKGLMKS